MPLRFAEVFRVTTKNVRFDRDPIEKEAGLETDPTLNRIRVGEKPQFWEQRNKRGLLFAYKMRNTVSDPVVRVFRIGCGWFSDFAPPYV